MLSSRKLNNRAFSLFYRKAKELKLQLDNNPIVYADNLKYQDADVLVEMLKLYAGEKYGREII